MTQTFCPDGRSGGERALRFDGVTYRYGSHVALDDLRLEVFRGETLALLRPSGVGRSTMISLLLGLLRPHAGTVEVLGTNPGGPSPWGGSGRC